MKNENDFWESEAVSEADLEAEVEMVKVQEAKVHQAMTTRDASALTAPATDGVLSGMYLANVLLASPEAFDDILTRWLKAHKNIRHAAIQATDPEDWVISKPSAKDGEHVPDEIALGYCSSPGCVKMRAPLGISILNPRGPEYSIVEVPGRPDANGNVAMNKVQQARFLADGLNGLTGERAFGIEGIRSSSEQFIGRADKGHAHDLGQAARTLCEAKITRLLAGVPRTAVHEIAKIMGLPLEEFVGRARRGSGYGTSVQRSFRRKAEQAAQAPVAAAGQGSGSGHRADQFWDALLAQAEGDIDRANGMLAHFSGFKNEKGQSFALTSIEQAKKKPGWLEKTIEKFEEHFGNKIGGDA